MILKIEIEIQPFDVPEAVTLKPQVAPRGEGFQIAKMVPLSQLDPETLGQLCDQFRNDVFEKAGKPLRPIGSPEIAAPLTTALLNSTELRNAK